jgi:hypothetical protein
VQVPGSAGKRDIKVLGIKGVCPDNYGVLTFETLQEKRSRNAPSGDSSSHHGFPIPYPVGSLHEGRHVPGHYFCQSPSHLDPQLTALDCRFRALFKEGEHFGNWNKGCVADD